MAESSHSHEEDLRGTLHTSPEVNQSPKAFLVINGEKPAEMETSIMLIYETQSPDCAAAFLGVMGEKSPQKVMDVFRIPRGLASFSLRISMDQYVPGSCNWQPTLLYQQNSFPVSNRPEQKLGWTSIISFSENGASEDEQKLSCYTAGSNTHCSWNESGKYQTMSRTGGELRLTFPTKADPKAGIP